MQTNQPQDHKQDQEKQLTLMEVQEKLGLFKPHTEQPPAEKHADDYLQDGPLGLI
jgi:hypothetical protein